MPAELKSVALFPIPNLVAFPGTVVPLHVFEPRYRKLVHDSVMEPRMIGVCHTRKTLSPPKRNQTLEQALSTNQATYEPQPVFSAGYCEIVQTTEDGRILANVHMQERLTLVDEVQAVPYRIVTCEPLTDERDPDESDQQDAAALRGLINARLVELVRPQSDELARELEDDAWLNLDPADYSFRIFQFLQLDPALMQRVLETRRASARLELIWDALRGG